MDRDGMRWIPLHSPAHSPAHNFTTVTIKATSSRSGGHLTNAVERRMRRQTDAVAALWAKGHAPSGWLGLRKIMLVHRRE